MFIVLQCVGFSKYINWEERHKDSPSKMLNISANLAVCASVGHYKRDRVEILRQARQRAEVATPKPWIVANAERASPFHRALAPSSARTATG
jgi:hypothetical protein